MGHKGEKCQFNTLILLKRKAQQQRQRRQYLPFFALNITYNAIFFRQEIVAHIAVAIERAVMIPFGNNNNREKTKLFGCVCAVNMVHTFKRNGSAQMGKKVK